MHCTNQFVRLLHDRFSISVGQPVCNVHVANEIGETALHLACAANNSKIAGLLLKAGADMNAVVREPETGEHRVMSRAVTPLVMAAGNGKEADVGFL